MATELTQEVAALVAKAILASDLSKMKIADATGIPYSTLNRKLKGHADFTFPELFEIAKATGCRPADFIPASFASMRLSA